jgi:hypothetical protein
VLPLVGGIVFWLSPFGPHEYGPRGVTLTAIFTVLPGISG